MQYRYYSAMKPLHFNGITAAQCAAQRQSAVCVRLLYQEGERERERQRERDREREREREIKSGEMRPGGMHTDRERETRTHKHPLEQLLRGHYLSNDALPLG